MRRDTICKKRREKFYPEILLNKLNSAVFFKKKKKTKTILLNLEISEHFDVRFNCKL